jgi:hypothetical protein
MKKFLFAVAALAAVSFSANAQRMTLHEEFTGENCGPCAGTNPTFWALCDLAPNPSKLIHISYMVPIPSAGFYCNRTTAIYTSRDSYYSVPFAPYGRYDGHVPDATASSPGHPGNFTQADIDLEAARPDSFTITATSAWDATFSNITTTVNVTCVTAWSGSGAAPHVVLRLALVKTDDFASPPGSNGENHFENVVQAMYPDVNGTAMATTWTAGMTHSYVVTGAVPSWVDKTQAPYMVTWIQDENNQSIAQAAKSAALPSIAVDVAAVSVAGPADLVCGTGTYSAAHTVTIKNPGTSPLTSATIFYQVDGGAYVSSPWTGSLAAGASIAVTMPAVSVPLTGSAYHVIKDSVGLPNGSADINNANNITGTVFFVENTTGINLPYGTSFEGDTSVYLFDTTGYNNVYSGGTTVPGHTGTHFAGFEMGYYGNGTVSILVLPELNITTPATTSMDYWVAYSQFTAANTDKLDIVYSTDCGSTWTTAATMTPTASLPASTTTLILPTASTDYKKYTTSLSSLPSGTDMIGMRVTRNGGSSIWIDDINVRSSVAVTSVTNNTSDVSIYPNPAKGDATLSFSLSGTSEVLVQIVDGIGRTVSVVTNQKMDAGSHVVNINTSSLSSGVYNVMVRTNSGTLTERLSVIK